MHIGTRMPPSKSVPFLPRSAPLFAPVWVAPPLSFVKDHERLVVELVLAQGCEHLANVVVE